MKKNIHYFLIPLILLLLIEFFSFLIITFYPIIFKLPHKNNFLVRDFTERVEDKRIVTMKKNLKLNNIKDYSNSNLVYSIYTDHIGSRIPRNDSNLKNNNKIFLFLGDSVPFGMYKEAEESFPYLFAVNNKNYKIINGAVPSYALPQAIARLDVEFIRIKNIKYIYLQIFDPVSQYALYQGNWSPTDSWAFTEIKTFEICKIIKNNQLDFVNKINTSKIIAKIKWKFNYCSIKAINNESDQRYLSHIKEQIDELIKINKNIKAQLIIAPVVVSPESTRTLNKSYAHALNLINNYLEDRSRQKNEFIFFDSRKFLDSEEDFIDQAHLSVIGAKKVANYLNKVINNLN